MAELLLFPTRTQDSPSFLLHDPGSTLALSDAEARAAALDIQRSWIVEAPAGSGKTALLIQRFLKLLAFGEVDRPGDVLAITFTRKAAQELRNRVLEQLGKANATGVGADQDLPEYERVTRDLAQRVLARDRARGWRILASPQQLNIRTIDSLCSEIAGSLPLLSGRAGQGQPTEDAAPLYEEAAERTLRQLGGPDQALSDALRCILLHRDGQIPDCLRLIAGMLSAREQWGELIPLDAEKLTEAELDGELRKRLESTLQYVVCGALERASQVIPAHLLEELAAFAARHGDASALKANVSPIACCAQRPYPPGTAASDHPQWLALLHLLFTGGKKEGSWRKQTGAALGFELEKSEQTRLKLLIEELKSEAERRPGLERALHAVRLLPPSTYPDEHWVLVKALFRVLRRALAELNVLFSERGTCDFTQVALTAGSLLRSEHFDIDLLRTSGLRCQHLLVDEMQDTSTSQYELLQLLSRDWDGVTQTMFLVGDPKQSIYAFRQARVERFLRTQATGRLGTVPLGALRLTANFRSQAELVGEFNDMFSAVLRRPEELGESGPASVDVPFVASSARRGAGASPALHWHARVEAYTPSRPTVTDTEALEEGDAPDDELTPGAEADARATRLIIERFKADWDARALRPGESRRPARVAVLARAREQLAPILAEFHKDYGAGPLPFRAVDIERLDQRPEVLDLLSLTRALLHPGDRIAWLAVLRSPVCGLTLADLLALTGEGPGSDPGATVPYLIETRAHLLSPLGQSLLDRTWPILRESQATLGRGSMRTQVERTWRSLGGDAGLRGDERANARRFLELLGTLEDDPVPLSVGRLARRLASLYAEPMAHAEAVDMMTIHKAKGLEWDLVLVPALERKSGQDKDQLLKWLELDGEEGAEARVILSPIAGKGESASALHSWLSTLQRMRAEAEAKRLLYVACTRAREQLHLFASCKQKKDGELAKPEGRTLLGAAWPAAEAVFARQLEREAMVQEISPGQVRQGPVLLDFPAPESTGLALAAAAETHEPVEDAESSPKYGRIARLPLGFDPLARFRAEFGASLPYPAASTLRSAAPFARPEGSFAARAFGNVVHRFLERISKTLSGSVSAADLLAELPDWRPRILHAFRGEGLPPAVCAREADRALGALVNSLADAEGQWLLAPHPYASSEQALDFAETAGGTAPVRNLRADRVFFAGPEPLTAASPTHLWIVDFKTGEQGGRDLDTFLRSERAKYEPQLGTYARANAVTHGRQVPIVLALFYPLLTKLLYWTFAPADASDVCNGL